MEIDKNLKCAIRIKFDSLNNKQSAYRDRIKQRYLPHYVKKMKYSNKKIMHPSEDRLAELTTQQIDRIIHIEKIKEHLL